MRPSPALRPGLAGLPLLCAVVVSASLAFAAEPFRVLAPSEPTRRPTVLIVPGCSGFAVRNSVNHYEERARELQALGYFVVFVDYLSRRQLTDCGGGRYVTHAQVAADVHEAARWIQAMPGVNPSKIFVIGWSYGAGGVLAALRTLPPESPPLLAKAAMYYPDCRRAMPWSSTNVSGLMLMGAMDQVALPALCDPVIKAVSPNSLRTVVYPNARHGFDIKGLSERDEFGRHGYDPEAAKASWATVLDFLR
jgi:dienelactone hydrolase